LIQASSLHFLEPQCFPKPFGLQGLQAYLEGLNLTVSASMVSQVILALLGLDSPSDCQRFASLLLQPPHWQQGDFATALWGAAAEPAASLLAKHRSARGK